jgi:hypothetical protein
LEREICHDASVAPEEVDQQGLKGLVRWSVDAVALRIP